MWDTALAVLSLVAVAPGRADRNANSPTARRDPSVLPPPSQQPAGEIFEWTSFGKRKPSMRGFARWLASIDELDVPSIRTLKILHDEYCVHAGRAPVTERRLAHLVGRCEYICKYRQTSQSTRMRYRVVREALGEIKKAA